MTPLTIDFYTALAVAGAIVLLLGLVSRPVHDRLPLSLPLLSLVVGVLLGPHAGDVLDPADWGDQRRILEEAARLTLAIGLMATALRLPPRHFLEHWRAQIVLLGLVMPAMWIATSAVLGLALGLPLLLALVAGAIVTPTDPIVASAIVTSESAKRRLPDRIRHNVSAESGANDGLATAFVFLPILLLTAGWPAASLEWVRSILLREIVGGAALGAVMGYVAARLLRWAEDKELMEQPSFLSQTVALGLLVVGVAGLLEASGVLAVFVAGLAFDNVVGGSERAQEANIQETVNQFFTLPIFALIGLALPLHEWAALGWPGVAGAVGVLLLRRLPIVLAVRSLMPPLNPLPDALFLGWFGPIGVSALLYAMLAIERLGDPTLWTISSLVITASIAAHGMTAAPLSRLYARRTDRPRERRRQT